jgi:hypothetical protein
MLMGIKFGLEMVWNILMYDNFKYFVKGIENGDGSVLIY